MPLAFSHLRTSTPACWTSLRAWPRQSSGASQGARAPTFWPSISTFTSCAWWRRAWCSNRSTSTACQHGRASARLSSLARVRTPSMPCCTAAPGSLRWRSARGRCTPSVPRRSCVTPRLRGTRQKLSCECPSAPRSSTTHSTSCIARRCARSRSTTTRLLACGPCAGRCSRRRGARGERATGGAGAAGPQACPR